MLPQHNTVSQLEMHLLLLYSEILCIVASISLFHCLLVWLYLDIYCESFQKLMCENFRLCSQKKEACSPLPLSLFLLKASTMAGAGAAVMGQETEATAEDGLIMRQREPVSLTLCSCYTLTVLTI